MGFHKFNIDRLIKIFFLKVRTVDIFIPLIIIFSFINSIRAAGSKYYDLSYEDDIIWIYWVSEHIGRPLSLLSNAPGTGYRPTINILYATGYSLWGSNEAGYYLLNGIFFAGSMLFLYKIIKLLSDRSAGVIAVLLYLFLDTSFVIVWKINYLTTIGEMFFITSSIYYFIFYFEKSGKKHLFAAIFLAIAAFFSKEPSIIIIPAVNIIYLFYKWNVIRIDPKIKLMIMLGNFIPILSLFYITIFSSEVLQISSTMSLPELIKTNLVFYMNHELKGQLKNPFLLLTCCIGTFLFHDFKKEKYGEVSIKFIKNIILLVFFIIIFNFFGSTPSFNGVLFLLLLLFISFILGNIDQRLGIAWFIAGLAPLLVVDVASPQVTYLAEANLGMVLFIGITTSKYIHCIKKKTKSISSLHLFEKINIMFILLVLIFQLSLVPVQISNTNNYHGKLSEYQTTFKESLNYLMINVPENGTVYYIPEEQRNKENVGQISDIYVHQLLCLKGRCDIEIRSLSSLDVNNSENYHGSYIALLSNLDIKIFNNEYQSLMKKEMYLSEEIITNGNQSAAIMKLK